MIPIIVWRFWRRFAGLDRRGHWRGQSASTRREARVIRCGIEPSPRRSAHRFPVSTTDRDAVHRFQHRDLFLYPWALRFNHLGMFGLVR